MCTSAVFATVALLMTTAYAAPSHLPTHYYRRCDNETHGVDDPVLLPAPVGSAPVPSCDLSGLSQPANALQPPAEGLELVMIALGQGTQNYTCGANIDAAPTPIGAVAELYDASCLLTNDPHIGTKAPASGAAVIGSHFFVDNTTPDFDINGMGNTQLKKAEETNAPAPAADVKWLRLVTQTAGTTSAVKEIYRLNTVGGLPPKTCEGKAQGEVVTVKYEAQYWIYSTQQPRTQSVDKSPPTPPVAAFMGAASRAAPFGALARTAALSSLVYMFSL